MDLDFSKLNELLNMNISEDKEKEPSKTPPKTPLKQNGYKSTLLDKNALQGQIEGVKGVSILQKKADDNKAERERARNIYREYQNHIKVSSQLQTEIVKGVQHGDDIYSLFLKAIHVISLMTSNKAFYSQIQSDIKAIYGAGLLEHKLLEIEITEVQERLERLNDAKQRNTESDDSLKRIDNAIKAHEERINLLKSMIEKGGESLTA